MAYQNKKIPKTHDLTKIHSFIIEVIDFNEEELELLDIISEYHIEESYPAFDRPLPSKEEIKKVLDFSETLFIDMCNKLDIDKNELM